MWHLLLLLITPSHDLKRTWGKDQTKTALDQSIYFCKTIARKEATSQIWIPVIHWWEDTLWLKALNKKYSKVSTWFTHSSQTFPPLLVGNNDGAWHHQIQTKSASSKSAFKINTTIYVNHFIGIYAIKVNSCPEKERDEEKREVKHGCLARANLKNNSSSGFPAVSYSRVNSASTNYRRNYYKI